MIQIYIFKKTQFRIDQSCLSDFSVLYVEANFDTQV
jgi:hypothetical protein